LLGRLILFLPVKGTGIEDRRVLGVRDPGTGDPGIIPDQTDMNLRKVLNFINS
jgi:hypothetical protein